MPCPLIHYDSLSKLQTLGNYLYYSTNWQVAGSIPDGVIGIFQ